VLVALIVESAGQFARDTSVAIEGSSIEELGIALFRNWVLPFEVLSMLLLAALVGAILLSRRESGESGEETPITAIDVGDPGFEDQPELTGAPAPTTTSGGAS